MTLRPASKLLKELIALPSINPAFLDDRNLTGEHRALGYLEDLGRKCGLEISFIPFEENRRNLLLTCRARGRAKQRVILAPHLDTVGVPNLDLLKPRQAGGRLYGRGACDTKGSVAAMFEALRKVAKGKRPQETELVFVGLVDEENSQGGSRALVAAKFEADLAIVGEPTLNRVVNAHKGDLWLRLATEGRAAHGSRPELGVNAVHKMAKVVDWLETDYRKMLNQKSHSLLGHPTINVGSILGGTQPNIVPDRCEISVDRRTIPGESSAGVVSGLKSGLKRARLDVSILDDKLNTCEPMETNPGLPLVHALMKTVRQRKPLGVDFFCDASVLSRGGIPSVVFGPGDIAQAHTADEWVALDSLEEASGLLFKFLSGLP